MPGQPILLKALLRERHWQNYATFCAEYDKVARRIDPDLVRTYPSRAQLHRWLTGSLRGLPYPDHCRVLEEMFPGWSAAQLFQPSSPELIYAGGQAPIGGAGSSGIAGPPVFAAPSVGLRPFIEQAFTCEHITPTGPWHSPAEPTTSATTPRTGHALRASPRGTLMRSLTACTS